MLNFIMFGLLLKYCFMSIFLLWAKNDISIHSDTHHHTYILLYTHILVYTLQFFRHNLDSEDIFQTLQSCRWCKLMSDLKYGASRKSIVCLRKFVNVIFPLLH